MEYRRFGSHYLVRIALGIAMCYTLKSRIDEIRKGEEDDLSDY